MPPGFLPLLTSSAGIRHYIRENDDGSVTFASYGDTDGIIERNKAMANHNDGYTPSRELRRVASIPNILIAKWLEEEGWNALDPDHSDKLAAKLNSIEFQHLRTAPGRLGVSNGVMR